MRILTVSHFFASHRGGIEIVAGRLASELSRLGIEVAWAASDASPPPGAGGEPGLRAIPLAASNAFENRIGIPYPLPFPSAFRRIWRETRACDAVLVHDGLYLTSVIAFFAASYLKKPLIAVQHIGIVPYKSRVLCSLMTLANRVLTRPVLARADQTVFISETTARYFADLAFKRRPELIFNGVDTTIFRPPVSGDEMVAARRKLGLPDRGKIVLFVGRFVEKKGLAVMERLARARSDLVFAFAGWGPLDPHSWQLANVHVFDQLSGAGLAELYRASDLFLLPSVGEGYPLVVQEALACGLPVICGEDTARADPAAAQLLASVAIDIEAPDRTAEEFGRALDVCLARDTSEARAARAAWAAARYSWQRSAAEYAALLQRLQQARARSGPATLSALPNGN